MRSNQVLLKMCELVIAYANRRQLPETRVDAVNLIAMSHNVVNQLIGFGYAPPGTVTKFDGHRFQPCLAQLGQRHELVIDQ